MNTPNTPRPSRSGGSMKVFLALLFGGLAVLALRVFTAPDGGFFTMLLPVLGGALVAAAIALLVVRERRERKAMTESERNQPDQGMPL
ncbi:hypothetical protein HL658_15770 [Azospirillum sp. RWY-5-1]|uniref:Uncharacterized protein n=1 Tax=Azospirillum oleiclasticum TaxID=2735135 RepID=A0ABX2TED3_9PROT|nr:hypothetical protein [Azospirillum oleiclasticum]NYZ14014.1 hypothetical protein [Azospirillum oleiclasticum]NYZ21498.1 hypothetical protein [Azospirillum oleiclasticum]